jgi:hypothetical protein
MDRLESIDLDVGGLDDRPPLFDLGLLVRRESFRRLLLDRRNDLSKLSKRLAYRRVGERILDGAVQLGDRRLRRALRRPETNQIDTWSLGSPASSTVGMSGNCARRTGAVTA